MVMAVTWDAVAMAQDCVEMCLEQPCNYWIDNSLATCNEIVGLTDCASCAECSVCEGAVADADDDSFVIAALAVFCAILCIVLAFVVIGACVRHRHVVSGQVRWRPTCVCMLACMHAARVVISSRGMAFVGFEIAFAGFVIAMDTVVLYGTLCRTCTR